MAQHELEMTITWENNVSFDVVIKENGGNPLTLVHMDENGDIATLWPSISDLMERYIKSLMAKIGKEMAQP